jgi:hypothetical protein
MRSNIGGPFLLTSLNGSSKKYLLGDFWWASRPFIGGKHGNMENGPFDTANTMQAMLLALCELPRRR